MNREAWLNDSASEHAGWIVDRFHDAGAEEAMLARHRSSL
jgi:hypothetical protein